MMDEPTTGTEPAPPPTIGEYRVDRELAPGRTYLATSAGGRRVVLKMLDRDCLEGDQLHPSVRERLARVRELAAKGVANLHGVERDGAYTFLVWDYVEGRPFPEASAADLPRRAWLQLSRELVLVVESLHASGIVHGAIAGGNVIVDANRRLRLTHVSPLLYADPRHDAHAVVELLESTAAARRESGLPLGRALAAARAQNGSLRELSGLLATEGDDRDDAAASAPQRDANREAAMRRRALLGAALVASAGLGGFAGINWYVTLPRGGGGEGSSTGSTGSGGAVAPAPPRRESPVEPDAAARQMPPAAAPPRAGTRK